MKKQSFAIKLLLSSICWHSVFSTSFAAKPDMHPNLVIHLTDQSVNGLKNAASHIGSNMKLELSVNDRLFTLVKIIAAVGFAFIGGFIIKNSLEKLPEQESKKTTLIQLCAGTIIALASFIYISKQC